MNIPQTDHNQCRKEVGRPQSPLFKRKYAVGVFTLVLFVCLSGGSILFRSIQQTHAAASYLTSWTGESSTMPGNPGGPDNQVQEVQDFIQSAVVQPDGTIWTFSDWDEGGNQFGEIRNGQIVGANENLGQNNHNLNDNSARSITDTYGHTWAVQDITMVGGDKVCRTDNTNICITGSSGFRPNALAIANDHTLMVGDNGPDQQIKFYDVSSGNPSSTPVRTFGDQGGVWAGPNPGLTGPTRFSGIWGVGQDTSGNYYVAGNFPGGGSWARSLQSNGTMNWQIYGKIWVSNTVPDMSTDGTVAYDHNAMYHLDYSQTTPGKETTGDFPYAVTIDPWNHPDDPRLSSYDCCDANNNGKYAQDWQSTANAHYSFTFFTPKWIRNYNGHKFMITTSMYGGAFGLWEQVGNFWVSRSFVNGPDSNSWPWGAYVDDNANLWTAYTVAGNASTIRKYTATGLDSSGNIVYSTPTVYQQINDFNEAMRLRYDTKNDILYISGFTPSRSRGGGWGDAGAVVNRYSHYTADTSSPSPDLSFNLPYVYAKNSDGSQNFEASHTIQDIEIVNNYLIAAFGTNNDVTGQHSSPAIFSLTDGSRVTDLTLQSPLISSNVGWMDMQGLTAGLRSNGEYLLFLEDDYRNKTLIYRWCPAGNCVSSGGGSGGGSGSSALNRSGWTASASSTESSGSPANALDGNLSTRWSSGHYQTNGDWFSVDMKSQQSFNKIVLDDTNDANDYARGYQVFVSNDGSNWGSAVASGNGSSAVLTITFGTQSARYIKVVQTSSSTQWWWSIDEFNVYPPSSSALNRTGWAASASSTESSGSPANALDGNLGTRWSSGHFQTNGDWFSVDMKSQQSFSKIVLDDTNDANDYARGYQVFVSNDGSNWGSAIASGSGSSAVLTITFSTQSARYIKIVQTSSSTQWWWSIDEFNVYS
ncbi:MAG TPA: discoidin domain-containing protein [Ktedonobacteraceae bacterium]|nr:discoidin domain-containing protein [Ktedonobacteraceae bacterium]